MIQIASIMRVTQQTVPNVLYHYTSRTALLGILEHGFAFMPCDRRLLDAFFGNKRPFAGDAQNFGMVCFTEAPPAQAKAVRKKGDHFIAMKTDWAVKLGIRKVRYFGPFGAWRLRRQAKAGLAQMKAAIRYPDDEALKLAYRNKQFAFFLGGPKHAEILDIYEYSQTWWDRKQREWRITQQLPFYDLPRRLPNIEGWGEALSYLSFNANDVAFLGCPTNNEQALRETLPDAFKSIAICSLQ